MSDDPRVTVPAEFVDALREALQGYDRMVGDLVPPAVHADWVRKVFRAARALVDAAERPAAAEECEHGNDVRYGCKHCDEAGTVDTSAPVSEPLCRCGPTPYPGTDAPMEDCPIHYPPPVPVSDEAEAAYLADEIVGALGGFIAGCACTLDSDTCDTCEFVAAKVGAVIANDARNLKAGMLGESQFAYGYRTACTDIAARLAGKEEQP